MVDRSLTEALNLMVRCACQIGSMTQPIRQAGTPLGAVTRAAFHWTRGPRSTNVSNVATLFLFLASLLIGPTPVLATGLTAAIVTEREIRLEFDGTVDAVRPLALAGPDRLVLDIDAADRTGAPRLSADGVVARDVRAAQFDARTTRVVLDLVRPAMVTAARWAPDGRGVVLALAVSSPGAWSQALSARMSFRPLDALRRLLVPAPYKVRVPVPPARPVPLDARIQGPAGRPLVVIDAGHGGHDPGSISPYGGVREKDVTLAIATRVRDRLLATGRMRVALTRDDDRYLVLQDRFAIARKLGAQLFISIHADSAANEEARGATIYTLSEVASDREAARLASRENRANIINGIDLSDQGNDVTDILIGLTQRETMNVSARFADVLHRESGGVHFKPGFHRFASLMVLKAPDVASVLYETGYMSNVDDVAWLTSEAGRSAIADGLARAASAHFARQVVSR